MTAPREGASRRGHAGESGRGDETARGDQRGGAGDDGAILVATSNPGKVREIARLLAPLGRALLTLADCGIGSTYEERGTTYEANARGKARHYALLAGRAAIAEDSGLEVEALGWKPGVHSARYGGPGKDDAARCRLLLEALAQVPDGRRGARYVAVAAVARPDGETRIFHGRCEGRIIREMRGTGGFGYDPVFHYPTFGTTFAAVEDDRKSSVSHRGMAFRALAQYLAGDEGRAFLAGGGRRLESAARKTHGSAVRKTRGGAGRRMSRAKPDEA